MYNVYLVILFSIAIVHEAVSQQINLSPRHVEKLNKISTGREKILAYHKFIKRDSIRHQRIIRKRFRRAVDSTANLYQRRFLRKASPHLESIEMSSINRAYIPYVNETSFAKLDSIFLDSVSKAGEALWRRIAPDELAKLPDPFPVRSNEELAQQISAMTNPVDLPDVNGRLPLPEHSSPIDPTKAEGAFNDAPALLKELPRIPDIQDALQYKDEILTKGQASANAAASKLVQSGEIRRAQERIAKLLSRYRQFSTDHPDEGIKRNSLEERSFKERLHVGLDITPLEFQPFTIAISPQVGYKLNRDLVIGVAAGYTITMSDSSLRSVSSNYMLRGFSDFVFGKGLFAHAEMQASKSKPQSEKASNPRWTNAYYVGLGKKFLVHPKIHFNLLFLYHLNHAHSRVFHQDRFQFRFGFSLSELALRSKMIYYNPNR